MNTKLDVQNSKNLGIGLVIMCVKDNCRTNYCEDETVAVG